MHVLMVMLGGVLLLGVFLLFGRLWSVGTSQLPTALIAFIATGFWWPWPTCGWGSAGPVTQYAKSCRSCCWCSPCRRCWPVSCTGARRAEGVA